jgi:signal transduction histidine kinase/HAMP domain-containing protein
VSGEQFKQTSSIINRLRTIMIIIACFILICTLALYFSSLSTLKGLQELNSANNLLNLNSQIVESISTSEKNLDDINSVADIRDLNFSYHENLKITFNLIDASIQEANLNKEIVSMLNEVRDLLKQSDLHYKIIFTKLNNSTTRKNKSKNATDLLADIVVVKQLILDTKEILRKIQIVVKNDNDLMFTSIYKNRFRPLIVAVSLSFLFFTFVITFGLTISKKIGNSVSNLLHATDLVAQGDLNYKVKILDHDEIGRLTDAFNKMIFSLKAGQDNLNLAVDTTKRLQSITASFSEALTLEQVYDIIFKQAFEALDAIAAAVVLVSDDKNFLELKRAEGHSEGTYDKWKKFPISADVPVAHSVRYKKPIYMEATEFNSFEGVGTKDFNPAANSVACLPLVISSEAFGSLSFQFSKGKKFDQDDKDFMMALARQCSQAIYRSQLYDNAKKAIEARDEFLSIASHELKTPLTPLKLQVQKLVRNIISGHIDTIPKEKLKFIAESSDRQISRLSKLIDNLLDVSRINTGKFTLDKTHFNLNEMIEEVLRQYAQHLKETDSQVIFSTEKEIIGYWDKVRIEQVFINLLTNAAKYAPYKPIHVKVTCENQYAKIIVSDEGPGISPDAQEKIFNRFERGESPENIGGLGLGLYISKQIMEAHHGKIYVHSSSSSGSVFVVELPLV